jgi:hypothetical protein
MNHLDLITRPTASMPTTLKQGAVIADCMLQHPAAFTVCYRHCQDTPPMRMQAGNNAQDVQRQGATREIHPGERQAEDHKKKIPHHVIEGASWDRTQVY